MYDVELFTEFLQYKVKIDPNYLVSCIVFYQSIKTYYVTFLIHFLYIDGYVTYQKCRYYTYIFYT